MRRLLIVLVVAFMLFAALFVAFGGRIYVDVVAPQFSVDEGRLPAVQVDPGDLPDVNVDPATPR